MTNDAAIPVDVAVIGGGPAGISVCLALSKVPTLKVALFESEPELGGIPRSSHIFFGMRDLRQIHTGSSYARKLDSLVRRTSVHIHTNATVIDLLPGEKGQRHTLHVASPDGFDIYDSRAVLLATGCYESSREARLIPGTRPSGIFTTGTLQKTVNLQHQKPGSRAVIIGSEHVAFSSVLTLRRAGMAVSGMLEEDAEFQTYPFMAKCMSRFYGFPVYRNTRLKGILGEKRVEGIEFWNNGSDKVSFIPCDTVVMTGKFRPDSSLIFDSAIEEDPSTFSPVVDTHLETSVPGIFAAGNVLHPANMHDLCALEGKEAAKSINRYLNSSKPKEDPIITIRAESPIRYVTPRRIHPGQARRHRVSRLLPCCNIQIEHTMKRPSLDAFSGNEKIWTRSYNRLIANTTIPLPIEKFDWDRVNPVKGIDLRIRS
ncbi:MAG: FAD-dependent oxidoreductase [Deltaproteobacteria bacterium]|nr:FAD-dependent oxidoreductase [Deltaproteobacteria bacterium]